MSTNNVIQWGKKRNFVYFIGCTFGFATSVNYIPTIPLRISFIIKVHDSLEDSYFKRKNCSFATKTMITKTYVLVIFIPVFQPPFLFRSKPFHSNGNMEKYFGLDIENDVLEKPWHIQNPRLEYVTKIE